MSSVKNRGVVLFETLLIVGLVGVVYFPAQMGVMRVWRKRLVELQETRLRYDGAYKPFAPTEWRAKGSFGSP